MRTATSGGSSITIGVQELPEELQKLDLTLRDEMAKSDASAEIKKNYPGALLIDSGFTKLDNKEAFYVEYTAPSEALGIKVTGHIKTWLVLHDGTLYFITAGAAEDELITPEATDGFCGIVRL